MQMLYSCIYSIWRVLMTETACRSYLTVLSVINFKITFCNVDFIWYNWDYGAVTADGRHEPYTWVSSAYMSGDNPWLSITISRSTVYRTNKIGSKTDHTADQMGDQRLAGAAARTYCFLEDRYDWNHPWGVSSMPEVRCKRRNKMEWSTVLKAADMSRETRAARSPLTTA